MTCWPDLVRAYLRARRQTLEAATSGVNYRYVLSVLARHLDANEVDPHADVAVLAVAVTDWVGARRWAASTRCTNLGIVRPFLDWAARRGHVTPGVAAELGNPRRPQNRPRRRRIRPRPASQLCHHDAAQRTEHPGGAAGYGAPVDPDHRPLPAGRRRRGSRRHVVGQHRNAPIGGN